MAIYKKGARTQLSTHFNQSEFDCSCDQCTITIIDPKLIDLLEKMRTALKTPIQINSGYRCAHKQEMLRIQGYETAVGISQHELGKAADLQNGISLGFELEAAARQAGFKAVGQAQIWIHVDLRGIENGVERAWKYKKS